MKGRALGLAFAVLLLAGGGLLTFFGLGGSGGGAMSRSWATLGPILAGFGVALAIVTFKRAP